MSKRINLKGKIFGKLKVLKDTGESWKIHKGEIIWTCQCDCGNLTNVRGCHLRSGHTRSCGCLIIERLYKHGYSPRRGRSRLYGIWGAMKNRCYNSNNSAYKYYGRRGIEVCDDWKNDYPTFRNWALENGYKWGLVLDRIDSKGNYEASNCQWLTKIANVKKVTEDAFKNGFVCGYLSASFYIKEKK